MESFDSKTGAVYAVARGIVEPPHGTVTLERIWSRAGAESVVSGRLSDPCLAELKELTSPERAWDNQPWPPEYVWERGQCLTDCHLLAIAIDDCTWLEQMYQVWESAPVAYEWHLLSQLQIGLGLRPHGRQPQIWTKDDSDFLTDTGALDRNTPNCRAWIALAAGDLGTAEIAIDEYRVELDTWTSEWNDAIGDEVRRILDFPGKVLRVELRALWALLSAK